VDIQGIDPFKDPLRARKKLGVSPDKPGLYPNLTVREHLAFFAILHGLSGGALAKAIEDTIYLLDMQVTADRKVKGFSHGQSVRVGLGRVIVHNPAYLFLDEPSRGLDVYAVRRLRELLLRFRDAGTGILFSSHVMQEVELLSDRLVVIAEGKICAEGDPTKLKEQSQTDNLEDAFMYFVEKEVGDVANN